MQIDSSIWIPIATALAGVLVTVAHARGKRLPLIELLLDRLMGTSPLSPTPVPVAPVVPAPNATGHPILDLVANALARLQQPAQPKVDVVTENGVDKIVVTVPPVAAK